MFMTVRWWLLLRKEDILNEVDLVDDGWNTRQLVHNISYIYIYIYSSGKWNQKQAFCTS